MAVYECEVCGYQYDEEMEGTTWEELPDDWVCPVCDTERENFSQVDS